jgi:hypothetical protein
MVVFDATMLLTLIHANIGVPIDSSTGALVTHPRERIEALVKEFQKAKQKIGIPTPALGEALVRVGPRITQFVDKLNDMAVFECLSFDQLSAIELAIMTKDAIDAGSKKAGSSEPWVKVKFDRQIVAIAKINGATAIYTDDGGLRHTAEANGFTVVGLADIPIPSESAQTELQFSSDDQAALNEIDQIKAADTPAATTE